MKMHGRLFYNPKLDRIDIIFDDGTFYDGLHCGECFDVYINHKWVFTRIEMSDNWYLVGLKDQKLIGLKVRI